MALVQLTQEQIESWVARHFDYKARRNGDELLICNPFLPGDDTYKFNISTVLKASKKGKYSNYWVHDWRPHAQQYNGSFLKFVQRYKGCTWKEAVKDVCGDGINLKAILAQHRGRPREVKEVREDTKYVVLPDNAVPITDEKYAMARKFTINYLASRGINYADAVSFRVHYTPTMVVFPYLEYDETVYWQGRALISKDFLFPDDTQSSRGKSHFLFGFDNAEVRQPLIITEAIFDALTIGPGGAASGGADLVHDQLRKIRMINPSYIVLAPDNDEAGLASLYNNWKLLSPYYKVYFVLPPAPYKDWNDHVRNADNKKKKLKEIRKFISNNKKLLTMADAVRLRLKRSI